MELELSSRYSNLMNNFHEYSFHVLGCGAIGSSAAIQLARSGATKFFLYDMDKVETVNIGVSQYDNRHVGCKKVDALEEIITQINQDVEKLTDGVFYCSELNELNFTIDKILNEREKIVKNNLIWEKYILNINNTKNWLSYLIK